MLSFITQEGATNSYYPLFITIFLALEILFWLSQKVFWHFFFPYLHFWSPVSSYGRFLYKVSLGCSMNMYCSISQRYVFEANIIKNYRAGQCCLTLPSTATGSVHSLKSLSTHSVMDDKAWSHFEMEVLAFIQPFSEPVLRHLWATLQWIRHWEEAITNYLIWSCSCDELLTFCVVCSPNQ